MSIQPEDVQALIAEVRRLRESVVLDDDAIDKLAVRIAQKMMDTPIDILCPTLAEASTAPDPLDKN